MKTPVLIIAFNRPDSTRKVFEAVKSVKPSHLYVAIDGPRLERGKKEQVLCQEVKDIFLNVDWPCEVKTLFNTRNLGCKRGPVSAINWLFEHEESGIILEDDILPLNTFFSYCEELLNAYKDDHRIGLIAGSNLISNHKVINSSYTYSNYTHIWGWATWRRAWKLYDIEMTDWKKLKYTNLIESKTDGTFLFKKFWSQFFDSAYFNDVNAWDYQWLFTCWKNDLLTIIPKHSLIQNIGFGPDATHTTKVPKYIQQMIVKEMPFPLISPKDVVVDKKNDLYISKYFFTIGLFSVFKGYVKKILNL